MPPAAEIARSRGVLGFASTTPILDRFSSNARFSTRRREYPSRMSIHRVIREARERLGLSVEELAEKVGVTRGAVQQWERENGTAPNRKKQPVVAEVLGL